MDELRTEFVSDLDKDFCFMCVHVYCEYLLKDSKVFLGVRLEYFVGMLSVSCVCWAESN